MKLVEAVCRVAVHLALIGAFFAVNMLAPVWFYAPGWVIVLVFLLSTLFLIPFFDTAYDVDL